MKKNILNRLVALFDSENDVFIDVKTEDGKVLRVYSTEVLVDSKIEEVGPDGIIALDDDEYKLEDGTTLVVADSLITEIKPAVDETVDDASTASTDSENDAQLESLFNKILTKFDKQEKKLNELTVKFEKLSKSPSVDTLKTKMDFNSNDIKNTKPRSATHALIGK